MDNPFFYIEANMTDPKVKVFRAIKPFLFHNKDLTNIVMDYYTDGVQMGDKLYLRVKKRLVDKYGNYHIELINPWEKQIMKNYFRNWIYDNNPLVSTKKYMALKCKKASSIVNWHRSKGITRNKHWLKNRDTFLAIISSSKHRVYGKSYLIKIFR